MIKAMYTVKDNKIQAYLEPHFTHDDEAARRTMIYSVNDQNHPFSKDPQDYSLYRLGAFDDVKGKIHTLKEPEFIVNLSDLVKE